MDRLETSMYLKDCLASDKNAIIVEFWDAGKGRWSSFEATRTAPGIAVTRKNKTIRFHERQLTESDRQTVIEKAIEHYNETIAQREAQKAMAMRPKMANKSTATATVATVKAANSTSERDFAIALMNKTGLNALEVVEIMALCKARYATTTISKVDEIAEALAAAGLE